MTSPLESGAKRIAIKIVGEIYCPDYGMHRETGKFQEFFEFLQKEIFIFAQKAREEALREAAEIAGEGTRWGSISAVVKEKILALRTEGK